MYKFPIARKIIRRIGHRGAFLLFLALLDVLYGISLNTTPGPLAGVNLGIPLHVWAYVWVVVGVFLAFGAFLIKDRLPYAIASFIKAIWAAALFVSWFAEGFTRGWVSAVIWAAFSGLVLVVSSWPEYGRVRE